MIKRLLSLFRKSKDLPPAPATATIPVSPQSCETPPARWLTKDDAENPFTLDGFDCYAFVSSMLSTTKDPDIAGSFVSLRSADGQSMRGSLPEDEMEIPCSLSYEYGGETVDGVLFKSAAMEEKWDIYLYDRRAYFCRSWTGSLSFVAEITPEEKLLRIFRMWASRSENPRFAIEQVDYLIKSHLYRMRVPHPLPLELLREPNAVAMYSFSQYGRLCCFGVFDSTLGTDFLKSAPHSQPNV